VITFPRALPIPDEVLEIARRLEAAGFDTWCVGGAVRDNLLDYENHDFDLATAPTPQEVQRLFRQTIPVGVEHGTVAVLDAKRQAHEVTTFRRDVRTDGRHAVVEFGVSLDQDLARRDFTINAIAHHPLRHEWRDPFEGLADLDRGVVRAVGDPASRFREDYLRILRSLRFAARFGFEIEPGTWAAARASAEGLRNLSAERVRDEWFRGLQTARTAGQLVKLWGEVGGLVRWLPEVGEGGIEGVDRFSKRDPILITSYLSADPVTTLTRLKCSNAEVDRGRRIGELRDRRPDPESEEMVRRWMAEAGPIVGDLLALHRVEDPTKGARLASAADRVRASAAPLTIAQLAVNGNDLKEAGVPSGPQIGMVLRALLDLVLTDPARNNRQDLLRAAQTIASGKETR